MLSESLSKKVPQNPLMKIPAIPTFGIYDKTSYLLMQQIHIIKSQNIMPNNLPPYIINQIKLFSKKYPKIIPEFFHITLNANKIFTTNNERIIGTNFLRINLVAHPYIFNNSKFSKSSKTHINCAIFKFLDEIDAIKESSNENNNIRINPDCEIMSSELNRDIILEINKEKNNMSLEPNNCAFLLNLNCSIINFYCLIIGTHNNLPTKFFIGNFVIITNGPNNSLLNPMTQKLLNYNNTKDLFLSLILNQMLYNDSFMFIIFYILDKIVNKSNKNEWYINNIKNLFNVGFKLIFEFDYDKNEISQKEHEEDLFNINNYYFDNIKNYITNLYLGSQAIQNFSEKMILCNLSNKYIVEILKKYIDYHLSLIHNIIYSYLGYYSEEIDLIKIKEEAKDIHKTKKWPKYKEHYCKKLKISSIEFDKIIMSFIDKNWKKIENNNIELFTEMCEALVENKNIVQLLEKIDEPIQEYFYYYVWVYKGKLEGIHKNFGKYSFICSNKINKIYHCQPDEKFNFCEKMIEVITKADAPYNQIKDN